MPLASKIRVVASGALRPGLCPLCGPTLFRVLGPWLRDQYLCRRCGSIPRMRALVHIVKTSVPKLSAATVFESSPGGPSSAWLADHCGRYIASQYFDDVSRGHVTAEGVRSEDLQQLTLEDGSVDVVITQDVLEHVLEPDRAFAEIARVLAPGGAHLFTVPIFTGRATLQRVEVDAEGNPHHLMDPDFHANPLGGGSLVIHEWGDDLPARIERVTGLPTIRYNEPSRLRGVIGEMFDVFVTRKPA